MKIVLMLLAVASAGLAVTSHSMDSAPPSRPVIESDADAGRKAVEARDWKKAIDSFNRAAAREPRNPDHQSMLGYAWRKSGNAELSFKHYNEALRLDPRHRGAHEYIGEAYLLINNVPKAEEHLAALDKLCPLTCAERSQLQSAIDSYKRVAASARK